MKTTGLLLFLGLSSVISCVDAEESTSSTPFTELLGSAPKGELRSISKAVGWINSPPLDASLLRGKVVLIDFWTYSCINWIRSAPYVRAWAEKYKDRGLVVIGVHSPEFGFEKDVGNIRTAAAAMNIAYPIAIDSEHDIWRGFRNNYWPALYFVDAKGTVRHRQFGEGEYDKAEAMIQQLLSEAGQAIPSREQVSVNAKGAELPADWSNLRSPENYLGYERTRNFASGGLTRNKPRTYAHPESLRLNHWSLAGKWTIGKEATVLNEANGKIAYRFSARDLHLVMGASDPNKDIRIRVTIDGKPPGADHGTDIDAQGMGIVTVPKLYQLVRQTGPIAERLVEIDILEGGLEVFAFTFG